MTLSIADAMDNTLRGGAVQVLDEFYPATPPPSGSRSAWNSRGVRPE
jgi:hypothetical protein